MQALAEQRKKSSHVSQEDILEYSQNLDGPARPNAQSMKQQVPESGNSFTIEESKLEDIDVEQLASSTSTPDVFLRNQPKVAAAV